MTDVAIETGVGIFVDTLVVCVFSAMKRSDIILCVPIRGRSKSDSRILLLNQICCS